MKKLLFRFLCVLVVASVSLFFVACGEKDPVDPNAGKVFGVTFSTGVEGYEIERQDVEAGGKLTKPHDFYRVGYTFNGWKKGETFWNFDTDTVNESFELVASWSEDTVSWAYTEGLAFNFNGDGYEVSSYSGESESVVVPILYSGDKGVHKVTRIGEGAFKDNTIVSSVTLSSSVSLISKNAFNGAINLENVSPLENVLEVGEQAFSGSGIKSVKFGADLGKIGESAFLNCDDLSSVIFLSGTGDLEISKNAFYGAGIEFVLIPDNLKVIEEGVFQNTKLSSVAFGSKSALVKIKKNAFKGTNLSVLKLPNVLKEIEQEAFGDIFSLTHVVLPSTLTTVGSKVFNNCSNVVGFFFGGEVPTGAGFSPDWKGGTALSYGYSSTDPGKPGYWKYDNGGVPTLYTKNSRVCLDFSSLEEAIDPSDNLSNYKVRVVCFYNSGVSSVSWYYPLDGDTKPLESGKDIEFFVDAYRCFVYNVEVYMASETEVVRENRVLECLDIVPKEGKVCFTNFDFSSKTMDKE